MPTYKITADTDCYVNGQFIKSGETIEIESRFSWGDPPSIEVVDAESPEPPAVESRAENTPDNRRSGGGDSEKREDKCPECGSDEMWKFESGMRECIVCAKVWDSDRRVQQ